MRLWRIARAAHPPFGGAGGLHGNARWNTVGRRIVYCSETPTGAMLEVLAHLEVDIEDIPNDYRLFSVEVPDSITMTDVGALPDGWQNDQSVTRALGDAWLEAKRFAALRVPSALLNHAFNVLLNPALPGAVGLQPVTDDPLEIDSRLLRVRR